jgi:hypothetical protein
MRSQVEALSLGTGPMQVISEVRDRASRPPSAATVLGAVCSKAHMLRSICSARWSASATVSFSAFMIVLRWFACRVLAQEGDELRALPARHPEQRLGVQAGVVVDLHAQPVGELVAVPELEHDL